MWIDYLLLFVLGFISGLGTLLILTFILWYVVKPKPGIPPSKEDWKNGIR